MKALDQAQLRATLSYDEETGLFTRTVSSGGAKAGDVCGCQNVGGYIQVSVRGRLYLAHRLAWLYIYGVWPPFHTDHVNGDKTDNRIANLRLATSAQNCANTGPSRNNTSGVKGVYWSKIRKKWVAQIGVGGRTINLGGFASLDEAQSARLAAEASVQGEFQWQRF